MTITYSLDISSSTFLGIHRLLLRWRGSIWKSIYPELFCWLFFYFLMSFTYRWAMDDSQRRFFEQLCKFFDSYIEYIPITFMLGFYVSAVFGRWGQIFDNLGWIDSPALLIATYVRGADEEARRIRRNIVRYMILVQAMVYRDISSCVQKRFPTMDHLVTAGFMTASELKEFDAVPSANIKYWTPIQWAFLLLRRAKDKKMIDSDMIYVDMLEKIRQFRVNVLTLTLFDWVPIPLVYTQVVNLAVRSYFIIALFGRQYMIADNEEGGVKKTFLFYIGWMKVAEVLLNPLGEDDDDFETNWIIDRNLQVGLSIVDDCCGRVPDLERDVFWEEAVPEPLYTPESAARPHNPMVGSCNDVSGQEDALLLQPRRRRLMSTVAGYDNSAFFKQNGTLENGEIVDSGDIVAVENHNPSRRLSVCANPFTESTHGRLLGSVRRKFSKAPNSRRDSTSSTTDFDRTMNGRLASSEESARRTPRGSLVPLQYPPPYNPGCASDSMPVPFTQSLNLTARKTSRPPIPGSLSDSASQEQFMSSNSLHDLDNKDENSEEYCRNAYQIPDRPPINSGLNAADMVKSPYQSNIWTINESMLPIIEEVQERLRRNTKDTESIHSNDSNSSSRKVPPKSVGNIEQFATNTANNDESMSNTGDRKLTDLKPRVMSLTSMSSGLTTTSETTTTTHAPIITSTDTTSSTTMTRPSTTMASGREMEELIEENEEEEDDEPSLFSQSPPPSPSRFNRHRLSSPFAFLTAEDDEPLDTMTTEKTSEKRNPLSHKTSAQIFETEARNRKSPIISASNSPKPSINSVNLPESRHNSLNRLDSSIQRRSSVQDVDKLNNVEEEKEVTNPNSSSNSKEKKFKPTENENHKEMGSNSLARTSEISDNERIHSSASTETTPNPIKKYSNVSASSSPSSSSPSSCNFRPSTTPRNTGEPEDSAPERIDEQPQRPALNTDESLSTPHDISNSCKKKT